MKLNPALPPENAVVWFFPTQDDSLLSWAGGVIGSAGINDKTRSENDPYLCVFTGIDGFMYVVDHRQTEPSDMNVIGPDNKTRYPQPRLLFKYKLGPSISTPVIVGNKIIAAGYHGIYLFKFDSPQTFKLLDKKHASAFESTPVIYDRKIYIGSRDGYLYCLGEE
jgi:hypothetical protein